MAAARRKRAHRVVAKAMLKAVADLHPEEALERLAPFCARAETGTARRALRAARIALMRRALEAPERAEPGTAEASAPEPPVPEVVTDPPAPKPIPKGKLMAVSLEDAARMLFVAPVAEAEPEAAPDSGAAAAEGGAALDWAAASAGLVAAEVPEEAEAVDDLPVLMVAPAPTEVLERMDMEAAEAALDEVVDDSARFAAPEAAAPAAPPAPEKRAKAGVSRQGRAGGGAALPDLSAQFAALAGDGLETLADPVTTRPLPGLDEGLRALDGLDEMPPAQAPAGKVDAAAAFAALEEPPPAQATPGKARMTDPAAAFAAMAAADSPKVAAPKGPAAMADPAAAFAALAAAEDEAAKAPGKVATKPKPLAIDLSAQFAAMSGDGEGRKPG